MYIDKMGIELEGGFTRQEYDRLCEEGNWHGDGSVYIGDTEVLAFDPDRTVRIIAGEAVSPASKLNDLQDWVSNNYPDIQNRSCGTHVHVSVLDKPLYDRLATKEFYYWFISRTTAWADQLLKGEIKNQFLERLKGENAYCCINYEPCQHHDVSSECLHHCSEDYGCMTHSCSHACEDDIQYARAWDFYTGSRSSDRHLCLQVSCSHEHIEECSKEECEHLCIDNLSECFTARDCHHECGDSCYRRDCSHDCDMDEECSADDRRLCHVPEIQRKMRDKDDSRYAHFNFCERIHGTLEIRLFPAFNSSKLTNECLQFVHDAIELYLSGPAVPLAQAEPVQLSISQQIYSDLNLVANEVA